MTIAYQLAYLPRYDTTSIYGDDVGNIGLDVWTVAVVGILGTVRIQHGTPTPRPSLDR